MKSRSTLFIGFVLFGFALLAHPALAQTLSFTTNTYARGTAGTHAVAVADFNGDGKLDVICVNTNSTMSLLTNNGSGTFVARSTISLTGVTYAVPVDLNGDGKPDLVAYNQNSPSLSTLTNDGIGGFTVTASISLSNAYPINMITGDVNGDGRIDVITANAPGNSLIVLTNTGTGTLVYNASIPVGNFPQPVALTDLDGDGRPDLACVSNGSLKIYTNSSSGVFGSNSVYSVFAYNVANLSAADLNGDGKSDLVMVDYNNARIAVWTNNGAGILSSNGIYGVGTGPEMAEIVDLNGDGKPDVVTANDNFCPGSVGPCSNGTLTILTNNGNGVLVSNMTITAGIWTIQVASGDFNGDGKKDLVAPNFGGTVYGPNTLTELLNTTVIPTPTVKLGTTGNKMVLAWPSSSGAFTLQTNANLSNTNWGAYTGTITDDGFTKRVTNSTSAGNQFFRLKQ